MRRAADRSDAIRRCCSWAARQANAMVLLGDESEFWVTALALAERLVRARYELAPATLGS